MIGQYVVLDVKEGREKKGSIGYAWGKLKHELYSLCDIKHGKILDVGCGEGEDLFEVVNTRKDLIGLGIDISTSIIKFNYKRSRLKKLNIHFVVADAHYVPFRDCSFDTVICSEVLEHLPYPLRALRNICRVVKQNGSIIITTPNKLDIIHETSKLISRILEKLSVKTCLAHFYLSKVRDFNPTKAEIEINELQNPEVKHHVYLFTEEVLSNALATNGFRIQYDKGSSLDPYPIAGFLDRHRCLFLLFRVLDRISDHFPLNLKWQIIIKATRE